VVQRLATLLTRHISQSSNSSIPDTLLAPSEKIDSLVILDRRVDMITPLLTQLTYEGLIDELIGIKNGMLLTKIGTTDIKTATTSPCGTTSIAFDAAIGSGTIESCCSFNFAHNIHCARRISQKGEQEKTPLNNLDGPPFCRTERLKLLFSG